MPRSGLRTPGTGTRLRGPSYGNRIPLARWACQGRCHRWKTSSRGTRSAIRSLRSYRRTATRHDVDSFRQASLDDLRCRERRPTARRGSERAPDRSQILGERLVAFRDSEGRPGLLAENCPHRGASLFFGRNEENGLRCVYHGWKFSSDGTCLDMPNEPAESDFRTKVRATAYPCQEFGGLIWAFMGPPERMGELPLLEWATVPAEHLHISKWLLEANYLQGMEGDIDTTHISFLHTNFKRTEDFDSVDARRVGNWRADTAPKLMLKETDYGFVYGGRRKYAGDSGKAFHWRLTHWLLPTFSMIPGTRWPIGGRCWIPIDDHHTWVFNYWYNGDAPLTDADST